MGIKLLIKRIVNRLTPKKAGYIYAVPHENGTKDGYWLGNYGSDNLLTFLAYLDKQQHNNKGNQQRMGHGRRLQHEEVYPLPKIPLFVQSHLDGYPVKPL